MREVTVTELLPIFRLVEAASKDETRYNLIGVHFDSAKGTGQATNGHILAEHKLADYAPIGWGKVILPPEACKAALKIKEHEAGMFRVEVIDKKIRIAGAGTAQEWPLIEANFPDTAQIWPKEDKKPVMEIGLDPELLLLLLKSLREDKRKKGVKLSIPGEAYSPIGVTVNGQRAVLMPMRI